MSEENTLEFCLYYGAVEALSALTKFADKEDTTIPILANINFTVRDGELLAYATDRFHAGELNLTRVGVTEVRGKERSFNIPATVFTKLKTHFKLKKNSSIPVVVTVSSDKVFFEHAYMSFSANLFDGEYPLISRLFNDNPSGRIGIKAVNFEKFIAFAPMWKALNDGVGWVITQSKPDKPIQITTEAFRGLIMPLYSSERAVDSWIKRVNTGTPVVSDSVLADTLERVTMQKEMLTVEVERLRAELDALKTKPLDTKPVEEVATEVKQVEVKQVKKPRRNTHKQGIKKIKAMPYVTDKMVARIEKKLSENVPVVEAVAWALGTDKGARFNRVIEALA